MQDPNSAFLEAAKPLIKYLAENHHPHTSAIVTATSAEVFEGVAVVHTTEFLVDVEPGPDTIEIPHMESTEQDLAKLTIRSAGL